MTSMTKIYDANSRIVDWDAVVNLMDDDLREKLHTFGFDRQKFFAAYAALHAVQFNEDFAPWVGGAW